MGGRAEASSAPGELGNALDVTSDKVDVRDRRYPRVLGFRPVSSPLEHVGVMVRGAREVAETVVAYDVAPEEVIGRI